MLHVARKPGQKILMLIPPSEKPTTIAIEVVWVAERKAFLDVDLPPSVAIGRPDSPTFLESPFYEAAIRTNALTFTEAR